MTTQIELFGEIQYPMINSFLDFVADRIREGETDFVIAISSGGGNVFCGLTAFNFLKACGAHIRTHNLGHVHSIAGVIFCAGHERHCVPSGRFLIHDIWWGIGNGSYSETQLREFVEGLQGDRASVASVLAEVMTLETSELETLMSQGLTLHAEDAKTKGLVTHISQDAFHAGEPIYRFRLD